MLVEAIAKMIWDGVGKAAQDMERKKEARYAREHADEIREREDKKRKKEYLNAVRMMVRPFVALEMIKVLERDSRAKNFSEDVLFSYVQKRIFSDVSASRAALSKEIACHKDQFEMEVEALCKEAKRLDEVALKAKACAESEKREAEDKYAEAYSEMIKGGTIDDFAQLGLLDLSQKLGLDNVTVARIESKVRGGKWVSHRKEASRGDNLSAHFEKVVCAFNGRCARLKADKLRLDIEIQGCNILSACLGGQLKIDDLKALSEQVRGQLKSYPELSSDCVGIEYGPFGVGNDKVVELGNGVNMHFKYCRQGCFSLESNLKVCISKPFWIGTFPVTQHQWQCLMGYNCSSHSGLDWDVAPVESVSWREVRGAHRGVEWPASDEVDPESFIGRFRAKTGLMADLPTESQWEYACRAGTTTNFWWGNSGGRSSPVNCTNTNSEGFDYKGHTVGMESTTPVDLFHPNPWGIYDMLGNVMELCLDRWAKYEEAWGCYKGKLTDPKGPTGGSGRVRRGGAFDRALNECTKRYEYEDNARYRTTGFRVVILCDHYDWPHDVRAFCGEITKLIDFSGNDWKGISWAEDSSEDTFRSIRRSPLV